MGVNASIRSLDAQDDRERRAAVRSFLRRGMPLSMASYLKIAPALPLHILPTVAPDHYRKKQVLVS